jgi:hypothetical protein
VAHFKDYPSIFSDGTEGNYEQELKISSFRAENLIRDPEIQKRSLNHEL